MKRVSFWSVLWQQLVFLLIVFIVVTLHWSHLTIWWHCFWFWDNTLSRIEKREFVTLLNLHTFLCVNNTELDRFPPVTHCSSYAVFESVRSSYNSQSQLSCCDPCLNHCPSYHHRVATYCGLRMYPVTRKLIVSSLTFFSAFLLARDLFR